MPARKTLTRTFALAMTVAAVALLVATLPAAPADADLLTSFPGTWCDAAKKLRYDYTDSTAGGLAFNNFDVVQAPGVGAAGSFFYTQGSQDDYTIPVSALPFTFKLFGTDYTTHQWDTNGFVALGGGLASGPLTPYWQQNPMPSGGLPNAVMAPFWQDMSLHKGVGGYITQGAAPFRVHIWEWSDSQFSPMSGGIIAQPGYNYQLRIYETTHVIEFHLRSYWNDGFTNGQPQIMGIESAPSGGWQAGLYRTPQGGVGTLSQNYAMRFTPVFDVAPVAFDDTYTVSPGLVLNVAGGTQPGALVGAADPLKSYISTGGVMQNDRDELRCVTKTAQLVTGVPAGQGTLNLAADGGFTYDPGNFCGTTSFTYRVNDPVGSAGGSAFQSAPATVTLNVACTPNQPPTAQCSVTTPAPYTVGQTIQFSSSGSSDTDGTIAAYEWTFPSGSGNTAAQNPTASWTSPGTYTATLRVRDDDGAWSAVVNCPAVTVADNTTPNLPPTAGPKTYQVTVGAAFATASNAQGGLAAAASDPEGGPLQFSQCTPLLPGLSLASDGHFTWQAPNTPQDVAFQYRVFDGAAYSACATVTLHVVENTRPLARFSASPNPAQVGETVSFADLSTDPDQGNTIQQWSWSFGDGHVSTQPNPSHAYGTVGTYHACLAVVDNMGATSLTTCHDVHVEHAAANPPPPPPPQPPVSRGPSGDGGGDDGPRLTVTLEGPVAASDGEQVTLTARVTGGDASLAWFKLHGDATLSIQGSSATFTFPAGADSVYIGVTASADGRTAQAAHLVSARPAAPTGSTLAAKVDGPDAGTAGALITLDGSKSVGATSYLWMQVSGPEATLVDAGSARTQVRLGGQEGVATFLLTASDPSGAAATALHSVEVTAAGVDEASTGFTTRMTGSTVEVIPHAEADKYVWTFGDGTDPVESDGPVTHTYAEDGEYDITMDTGSAEYKGTARVVSEERAVAETRTEGQASMDGNTVLLLVGAGLLAAILVVGILLLLRARRRTAAP